MKANKIHYFGRNFLQLIFLTAMSLEGLPMPTFFNGMTNFTLECIAPGTQTREFKIQFSSNQLLLISLVGTILKSYRITNGYRRAAWELFNNIHIQPMLTAKKFGNRNA